MTFDRAWRTFIDEESNHRAPAALEARVQQAIAVSQPRRRRRGSARLVLAASIGIAAAWWFVTAKSASIGATNTLEAGASRPLVSYAAPAAREQPDVITTRLTSARARRGSAPPPVLRASSAAGTLETFQLVRLRLPRQALATLGFLLIDPEGAGVVDVDVLVGEDGLPRHIRKVWLEP